MEKSLPQRIARFLEIVNYFLLIPTSLIELGVLFIGLISLSAAGFESLILIIIVSVIYCFGGLLLYGYRKHSRGEITITLATWLWIGTILFNGVPFLYLLFSWISANFTIGDKTAEFWFYNVFGSYFAVVVLAAVALICDLRDEFKVKI